MRTNFINSVFASITILLIAGCASMTQAPSTAPSATVSIREWSAAYYGSAAAGKGTLYYQGRHHFTILSLAFCIAPKSYRQVTAEMTHLQSD
jgi:hypothetical protein